MPEAYCTVALRFGGLPVPARDQRHDPRVIGPSHVNVCMEQAAAGLGNVVQNKT